ncbi:PAN/Apple domain-containing protein [Microvirga yunnanensis]|uniref:PAN/Apple domain-containing protein n=1 Tax=Microvirga yunnanensis TaxID=2953740 RepID=UPI0021C9256D|nr:PAN/Apple domain-containing protein [Microvirga sp. HBU65207]
MQVRHDTSLLEKAIEQVLLRASIPTLQAQAEALEKTNKAVAIRRVATGAAIALVAIGLGLGIKFALDRDSPPVSQESVIQAQVRPDPIPQPPMPAPRSPDHSASKPEQPPSKPDIVTTNFTKFANRQVELLGRSWTVSAGHHFDSEADTSWKQAWCYTVTDVNGVEVKVELASRMTPAAKPIAPTANLATMQHAGLDITDALTLASRCPWDDKQFSVADLQVPASAKGPKPLPPVSQPQIPVPPVLQPQPQQEFIAADDFDIPGGDYRVEKEVPLELCTSLCRSEAQCRAYTYNKTARWCFLKDRFGEAQRFVGAFSGMKKTMPTAGNSGVQWR